MGTFGGETFSFSPGVLVQVWGAAGRLRKRMTLNLLTCVDSSTDQKKKLGDDLVTNLCATKIGLKPLSYQGVWYSVFQGGTIYYSVVKCSSY